MKDLKTPLRNVDRYIGVLYILRATCMLTVKFCSLYSLYSFVGN